MNTYKSSILKPRKEVILTWRTEKYLTEETIHLIIRLVIQAARRPISIIPGIIQPLLWLILFGSLFQNAPVSLFNIGAKYGTFLSCGIIVFTSFTGSLNAGLPLIFDREFGFLNRLLVAPIISKENILLASSFFIVCITMIQTSIIIVSSMYIFKYNLDFNKITFLLVINLLITSSISNLSIALAFILPGHIEFLAITLIVNLPILFSSTALAPLYFMPYWLQIIAQLNPLTYAIESIRLISITNTWSISSKIIETLWIPLNLYQIMLLLSLITLISFTTIKTIIYNKLE